MNIITSTEKLSENHQNSFWYFGDEKIATLLQDDREILISVCGEIAMVFPNEDFFCFYDQAVHKALTLNYDDQKLKKVLFDECNWFDFLYKKNTSQTWEDIEGDECFSYDQALKNAIDALNDDEFWEQF